MEVEVSSREGKSDLITLDLLGGCASVGSKDLDLGLKASFGCHSHLHPLDLNLLPDDGPKPAAAPLFGSQSVCTIEKVKWALERAERESRGRETETETEQDQDQDQQRRRGRERGQEEASEVSPSPSPSPSSSSSITTASTKRRVEGQEGGEEGSTDGCESAGGSLVAAGCPSCLSYVLISKQNPRCPRCDSQVPLPVAAPPLPQKRPRIDLNFALRPL